MKQGTRKFVSAAVAAAMLAGCAAVGFSASASTGGTLCSKYSTNPDGNVGKQATITIDGDASDWSEDMLIARGAAWDVANHYKGGHENCVLDTYALFATWDDDNLYIGWQMVNTTDTWANSGDGPLSDGGRVLDVPLILALSVDESSTSMSNKNEDGGSIWGQKMGLSFDQHVDHLFYMSGKVGNGSPAMFTAVDDEGNTNYTDGCQLYSAAGIEYAMDTTNICSSIWGLNSSDDTSDIYSDSADWVDYKTYTGSQGTHDTTYDSFYEMSIPLDVLGIDRNYIETNGIGAMLIATRGESGLDCIPYDDTMLDNATGDYSSDSSTSAEKDDEDVITSELARIGSLTSDGTPSTTATKATSTTATTKATEATTASTAATTASTAASTDASGTTAANLTVKATSNMFPSKTVKLDSSTETVTVTCSLKSAMKLVNGQLEITYDPTVLSFDSSKNSDILPNISKETTNATSGVISAVFSDVSNLYDFTSAGEFVTLTFDVLSMGSTTVDIEVEELSVGYLSDSVLTYKNAYVNGSAIDLSDVSGFTGSSFITSTTITYSKTEETTSSRPVGDVNGDGSVSISDVTYLQKSLARCSDVTALADLDKTYCDVDGDGYISIKDATAIQMQIVGIS